MKEQDCCAKEHSFKNMGYNFQGFPLWRDWGRNTPNSQIPHHQKPVSLIRVPSNKLLYTINKNLVPQNVTWNRPLKSKRGLQWGTVPLIDQTLMQTLHLGCKTPKKYTFLSFSTKTRDYLFIKQHYMQLLQSPCGLSNLCG